MWTIAGGILLAAFILFIVLPLLGATIAAIFETIRSLVEVLLKIIPGLFCFLALIWGAATLTYDADFRQNAIIFTAVALAICATCLVVWLRLRFGSFHSAFRYMGVRCRPVFSIDSIVRKSEAIKKYKAIEPAAHTETERKVHEETERKKLSAMDNVESLLEKVTQEFRNYLSIEIIRNDEEGTISLNVNNTPSMCVSKYNSAGWQLLYAESHSPDPNPYLAKSTLAGLIKKALKRELVNAVNAPQNKTVMDPTPNKVDTPEQAVQKEADIIPDGTPCITPDRSPKTVTVAPNLVIVGIGGAGGNMLNDFVKSKEIDCHTIGANTDSQALELSAANEKFLLDGARGLGLGGNMLAGAQIGERCREEFLRRISGYDTVILCAGLGGGTGSGVTHVFAKAAMDAGLNVLCFCTLPFHFEGKKRHNVAIAALNEIQSLGVWIEVFDNQKAFSFANDKTTFADAFRFADQHFISLIHEAAVYGFDRHALDLSRCKVS